MTYFGPEEPPIDIAWIDSEIAAMLSGVTNVPGGDVSTLPPLQLQWVPVADAPVEYSGSGAQPNWNDVYTYTSREIHANVSDLPIGQAINGQAALHVADVTAGETIKSVSGFLNQTVGLIAEVHQSVSQQLDQLSVNIGAISAINDARFARIEGTVSAILAYAIPSLQAQITHLRHDLPLYVEYAALSERQWTIAHVLQPLQQQITANRVQAKTYTDAKSAHVLDAATHAVTQEAAVRAAETAALGLAVKKLTDFVDKCGEPMCQTMGPNTPLGKLLKALGSLATLAAIADLLSLTFPELEARLSEAIQHVVGLVTSFEGYFSDTSRTLGDILNPLG